MQWLSLRYRAQTSPLKTLEEHKSTQNHQHGVGIDIASFNILTSPKREKGPKKAGSKVKNIRGSSALHMIPSSTLYPTVAVHKNVIMWVCHRDIYLNIGGFFISVTGVTFPWELVLCFAYVLACEGRKIKVDVLPFILLVFYSKQGSS